MSRESTPDIIQTATVAIFSPDMRTVIVIVNERLGMILPPGWRKETIDADIFATAVREVEEEIWLNLLKIPGNFLDQYWATKLHPIVIHQENFVFSDNQKRALNSLYFFQLADPIDESQLTAELHWLYYTKAQIGEESICIREKEYVILDPTTKEFILRVMQD
jgi:8-oxo-dGTP pyrophosphatase MutT (NUDIX family)